MLIHRSFRGLGLIGLVCAGVAAHAANIYVTSSGLPSQDDGMRLALQAAGHTVTIGQQYFELDGSQSLAGFGCVVIQPNFNWPNGDMPISGQDVLVDFVTNGGGLVTVEWTLWLQAAGNYFQVLSDAFPSVATAAYNGLATHTFELETPNITINAGLPSTFEITGDWFAGTETNVADVKPGASAFYRTTGAGPYLGLTGWDYGAGRVAQFSQTVGVDFLNDAEGFRLMGNVVEWVSQGAGTTQIPPDSFLVRVGRLDSGTLGSLLNIDGQRMRLCRFIVPNQQVAPVTIEFDGTSPISAPAELRLRTYANMANTGAFIEILDLFDWNLNTFSATATATTTLGTSAKVHSVLADAPVARFVNASNRMRGRMRVRQSGPSATSAWCVDVDQIVWLVR